MPATYIRDYYVQLAKDDKNMIEGWVQLEGSDKEQKITLDIPELKVKKEVTTDANGYASFLIKSKPMDSGESEIICREPGFRNG